MNRRILLVYPEFPSTYWSFHSVFKYTRANASYPPLGLLTVAAMIPPEYDLRLVDMNVEPLTDRDVEDADIIFISAMLVQKDSFEKAVSRCSNPGKTIVAGGPYPTSSHNSISGVDHFILGECEEILTGFFRDLKNGSAKKIYKAKDYPDISNTPPPRFDLIDTGNYYSMALQFSRGCPFNCEFCDIIELFGRVPRTKTPQQMLLEFEMVFNEGFRGSLFIVDDNFIGNKNKTRELLHAVIPWQKEKGYPFTLYTEASINFAEDDELTDLMVEAGFNMVFIGIETPSEDSLKEANKGQNLRSKRSLLGQVRHIQEKGLEVCAGFIVGFDSDNEMIFSRQKEFINNSAIPMAMMGLLQALPSSRLYRRLEEEGRLEGKTLGNNTHDLCLNFKPRMNEKILVKGYVDLLKDIYRPAGYFGRAWEFLKRTPRNKYVVRSTTPEDVRILLRFVSSMLLKREGRPYLFFLFKVLLWKPALFPEAARFAIMGEHLIEITREITGHYQFATLLEGNLSVIQASVKHIREEMNPDVEAPFRQYADLIRIDVRKRFRNLPAQVRLSAKDDLDDFLQKTDEALQDISSAYYEKINPAAIEEINPQKNDTIPVAESSM